MELRLWTCLRDGPCVLERAGRCLQDIQEQHRQQGSGEVASLCNPRPQIDGHVVDVPCIILCTGGPCPFGPMSCRVIL